MFGSKYDLITRFQRYLPQIFPLVLIYEDWGANN